MEHQNNATSGPPPDDLSPAHFIQINSCHPATKEPVAVLPIITQLNFLSSLAAAFIFVPPPWSLQLYLKFRPPLPKVHLLVITVSVLIGIFPFVCECVHVYINWCSCVSRCAYMCMSIHVCRLEEYLWFLPQELSPLFFETDFPVGLGLNEQPKLTG